MNILYIGPYRQKNIIGIHSQILLLNLTNDKSNSITARPIYTDFSKPIVSDLHNDIVKLEKTIYDSYDVVIQHVPLSMACPIQSVKSNIIIPVLSAKNLSDDDVATLSKFDKILVDNKNDYNRLSLHKSLASKVNTYEYSFNVNIGPEASIDLGMFNHSNKIYFIGEYAENVTNISNICKSFVSNTSIEDAVLIIFLLYPGNNQVQELENHIREIYSINKPSNIINRILIIPIDTEVQHLAVIHKVCDTFISLQDDNSNYINLKLSQAHNSSNISFDISDYSFSFDRNKKFDQNGYFGPSESSVNEKLKKYFKFKTTSEIVPFKKTPINKLI